MRRSEGQPLCSGQSRPAAPAWRGHIAAAPPRIHRPVGREPYPAFSCRGFCRGRTNRSASVAVGCSYVLNPLYLMQSLSVQGRKIASKFGLPTVIAPRSMKLWAQHRRLPITVYTFETIENDAEADS